MVVMVGGATVGRSWDRADGGVAGGSESFLITFSVSEVEREERDNDHGNLSGLHFDWLHVHLN